MVVAALVGVTASGKSSLALALARQDPAIELVSVDSMQVYRGMDIGTAKPSAAEQAEVHHHLLDLVDPDEEYTVARFQCDLAGVLADIDRRGAQALLVGGTGLYLRAATDGLEIPGRFPEARAEIEADPDTEALHRRLADLDPTAATRMEPTNRRRVVRALEVTVGSGRPFSSYGGGLGEYPPTAMPLVGIRRTRPDLDERIAARYAAMMDAGFLDEVRALATRPAGLSRTARQALGYRELLRVVEDGEDVDEMVSLAVTRTRQFARRQERWFRRDPRIRWVDATSLDTVDDLIGRVDAVLAEP